MGTRKPGSSHLIPWLSLPVSKSGSRNIQVPTGFRDRKERSPRQISSEANDVKIRYFTSVPVLMVRASHMTALATRTNRAPGLSRELAVMGRNKDKQQGSCLKDCWESGVSNVNHIEVSISVSHLRDVLGGDQGPKEWKPLYSTMFQLLFF